MRTSEGPRRDSDGRMSDNRELPKRANAEEADLDAEDTAQEFDDFDDDKDKDEDEEEDR